MMKTRAVLPTLLAFIVAVMLTVAPAFAQQITGVAGFAQRHRRPSTENIFRRRRRSSVA